MIDPAYFVLAAVIFVMNIIPAFMPPTWIILAIFYIQFNLGLVPTVIIGASSAALGRVCLALLSRHYLEPYLPKIIKENFLALGEYFKKHTRLTAPIVFAYAFLPIPSNQVFIIAGLSNLNLSLIALSFLFGRLISYTFWISVSNAAVTRLDNVFSEYLFQGKGIAAEILSFSIVIIVGLIPWKKVLRIKLTNK